MRLYHKITLIYLAFGVAWIVVTDTAAFFITPHLHAFALVGLIKGWFYVLISALVIFWIVRYAVRQQEAANKEKVAIFHATIGGAHHVLLNYLNQMQLVTMEAERVEGFDKEIVELSKSLSDEAACELKHIGELKNISSESIDSEFYRALRKQG